MGLKFYRVGEWSGKIEVSLNGEVVREEIQVEQSSGNLCSDNLLPGKDMAFNLVYQD